MSEQKTAYTEDCCFNTERDQCRGGRCVCHCHVVNPSRPANEAELLNEVAQLRQERRDGDTARIRMNHDRIEQRDRADRAETALTAAQATIAQRDAQVAALQADRDAWRKEREGVANLLYTQEGRLGALTEQLAARDAQVAELTAALSMAAGEMIYQDEGLDWCRICDQTAPTDLRIDHAPDCPFGLLARTPAVPEATA